MLNRALSDREIEILHMIRPSTWRDWVEEIRKETENNRFSARKLIKNLRNANANDRSSYIDINMIDT